MNIFFDKPTPAPLQGGEQWNSFSGLQYFIILFVILFHLKLSPLKGVPARGV